MNYHYNSNQQPNTVRGIYGSHHHEMQWDAKGNLVRHRNHHAGYDRRLCWDEQNRLMGVADNSYLSLYQYDANGDRTYKLTGRIERQNVSGGWRYFYVMDKPTLYASPYLVATHRGYTKHYYAESERVASRIGGGGLHGLTMTGRDDFQELLQPELPLHHPSCIPNNDEFIKKCDAVTQRAKEVARCLDSEIRAYAPLESFAAFSDILNEEPDCYWYHTDHLGSSSWITYTNGSAVEHLHYLSWGEDFVRQRSTDWNAMYTFSAKERDTETGYSYFGARYYNSDLSIWLSVDPMSDKYPSFSPYVYCANNPIKLVDPNGEDIWTIYDDGTISRQKNTKIDRIDVVDKDKIVTKGTEAKYGTIKQHTRNFGDTRIDFFDINDDALATEAFENIANNTSMEWTHAKIGEEGSNRNIVGTSHSTNSTAVGDFLLKTGYTLREVNHNHPSGLAWPSGNEFGAVKGDIPHAKEYEAKFPNIRLNIYVNGKDPRSQVFEWYKKGYHPYTQHSPTVQQ